ncbi:AgmX/PglI C-terminal domain-containing protein [Myxococcus sp. RHSTA-1-4]|uniref:AgmX/PglI C-terminal domain-containing protein n=1 Tax=Myxococcus sp. RHSTA-1-4 TaxID=2874601 RepID=UPI001CBD82F0|nr:AgmX/PglI C-terminal domain-containing protein [Myxococcus sp. RHSTA-1-4]MBZ4419616.1 zinc-ribbon domain-containing protein [Myxococcus sp. RHSTA-1-4]
MNFTCDNCQKRYSIADEKVRGKTVKVRCKNCQNVITVEGPAEEESTRVVSLADVERIRAQERSLAEPAAAPVAAAPVARAPAAAPQTPWEDEPTRAAPLKPTASPWFAMVRNKQEGPLDEGALREMVATGTVSGRSFFWQQGMADWKRGSDIPELAGLFAPPPAPEPPPPPVAEPPPAPARSGRGAQARREPEPQPFMPEPEPTPAPEQQPSWEQQQAWEQQQEQDEPERTFYEEPEPRSNAQGRRGQAPAPAASAAPLNELFSDLDLPGNRGGDEDDGRPQHEDPLAALGGGDDDERKPVEDTRHFAAKSGVTRRNPAWKYAVFILALLVIPLGGAYLLSETLGVVPLRVKTVDAQGNAVEETVFSAKGVGALRDKLMGRSQPAPVAPSPPPAEKRAPAPAPAPGPAPEEKAPVGAGAETGATTPPPSAEQLQAVYGDADKKDAAPEVRKDAEVAATDSEEVGGPSDEEVERVVDKAQEAFRSCVENELRKNPSFRVGKVTLTATVGTSGKVKAATLDKPALNRSAVGTCIRDRAKNMVFSAFSGEDVDLEIPLVLSGTM